MSRGPSIAVLDYGAGNVRSAQRGLRRAGGVPFITDDADAAAAADALVIPGVGHFGTCLRQLRSAGLEALVRRWIDQDRDVFGICVGLQLLYEGSDEAEDEPGLGLLSGAVVRFPAGAIVPHMGWDVVRPAPGHDDDALLAGVAGERCYFVHSYYAIPTQHDHVVATCWYAGADFPCVVREGKAVGTQFHPEKSGAVGDRLLSNWVAGLERG